MFILGLTGSIAMGKTWGSKCFRRMRVPVHEADACVHALMAPGGAAVGDVLAAFPDVADDRGGIDRQKLGAHVFGQEDGHALEILEGILHPRVVAAEKTFLARHARRRTPLVVLDIPLLFETGARVRVDAVVTMSAPAFLQRQRALRRRGMTEQKFQGILARQTPDWFKRQVSEFVVSTGATRGESLRQIAEIVTLTRGMPGSVWSPHWNR